MYIYSRGRCSRANIWRRTYRHAVSVTAPAAGNPSASTPSARAKDPWGTPTNTVFANGWSCPGKRAAVCARKHSHSTRLPTTRMTTTISTACTPSTPKPSPGRFFWSACTNSSANPNSVSVGLTTKHDENHRTHRTHRTGETYGRDARGFEGGSNGQKEIPRTGRHVVGAEAFTAESTREMGTATSGREVSDGRSHVAVGFRNVNMFFFLTTRRSPRSRGAVSPASCRI